jgi:hypothetical protein
VRLHPGRFVYLCATCFNGMPSRLRGQLVSGGRCTEGHPWAHNKMLFHRDAAGRIAPIKPVPFTHAGAYFLVCQRLNYCGRLGPSTCKFAHSMVERDVWRMERDHQGSRDELVALTSPRRVSVPQAAVAPPQAAPIVISEKPEKGPVCPFRVIDICYLCWSSGVQSSKHSSKDVCTSKFAHPWSINIARLLVPGNKRIKPLPSGNHFAICWDVARGVSCKHGSKCQFAHSPEEIKVWTWMMNHKGTFSICFLQRSLFFFYCSENLGCSCSCLKAEPHNAGATPPPHQASACCRTP